MAAIVFESGNESAKYKQGEFLRPLVQLEKLIVCLFSIRAHCLSDWCHSLLIALSSHCQSVSLHTSIQFYFFPFFVLIQYFFNYQIFAYAKSILNKTLEKSKNNWHNLF